MPGCMKVRALLRCNRATPRGQNDSGVSVVIPITGNPCRRARGCPSLFPTVTVITRFHHFFFDFAIVQSCSCAARSEVRLVKPPVDAHGHFLAFPYFNSMIQVGQPS